MNVQFLPLVTAKERHLPFERVALVLQGGGALGAYQAGVYEAPGGSGRSSNLDRRYIDRSYQRGYYRRQSAAFPCRPAA